MIAMIALSPGPTGAWVGSHQRIVNVSSGAGSLTETTSGVNAVCSGWVATDMGGPGRLPIVW